MFLKPSPLPEQLDLHDCPLRLDFEGERFGCLVDSYTLLRKDISPGIVERTWSDMEHLRRLLYKNALPHNSMSSYS